MTTDLAAPPQTRPPHINPQWWYRATWHARQTAINTHLRNTRAAARTPEPEPEPTNYDRIADSATQAEAKPLVPVDLDLDILIALVDKLLTDGATPAQLIEATGRTIGSLESRARRAGRVDLARQLSRIRLAMRRKQCPGCGQKAWPGSERCNSCRSLNAHQQKRDARIENLTEMLDADPTLRMDDAAHRFGYSGANGLNRLLLRAERHDLIDRLAVNGRANQRKRVA